jgi:hypothetical protein
MRFSREQCDEFLGFLVVFCGYCGGVVIVADVDHGSFYLLSCAGVCEDETVIAELFSVE